jgi:4-oxalocrotonate tautomerase
MKQETAMPHVIVKMYSGRSEKDKKRLAVEITEAVTKTLKYGEESVSVAIEEVEPRHWVEKVYNPDILGHPEKITNNPATLPKRCDLRAATRDSAASPPTN